MALTLCFKLTVFLTLIWCKSDKSNIENGVDHFCDVAVATVANLSRDPLLTAWTPTFDDPIINTLLVFLPLPYLTIRGRRFTA